MLYQGEKEVIDEMHSVELERKLKLPDPTKAMEGVWKLLKRKRQQLDTPLTTIPGAPGTSPGQALAVQRRARIEAERAKGQAQGVVYTLRASLR